MGIFIGNFFGSYDVGIFCSCSEEFVLVPYGLDEKNEDILRNELKVDVVPVTIAGSFLVGVLSVANSNGIIVSDFAYDEEVDNIKKILPDINVVKVGEKFNAVGNLILANNKGAIVTPGMDKKELKKVEDALGVEVVKSTIAGRSYVGSIAIATDAGALLHVETSEDERSLVEEVLKVRTELGTVNNGVTFLKSGIVANKKGAIVGSLTTGPELMIISRALSQQ